MPTPAERRALLFVGAVAVLGVGWRAAGEWRRGPDVGGAQPELERQLLAAERVRDEERAAKEARKAGGKPAGRGKARRRAGADSAGRGGGGPSSDSAPRRARRTSVPPAPVPDPGPVDLDRADSAAIVGLPGVGPALAGRILANRREHGSFGGLEALDGVPGVGPALLSRLAGRVTFSGPLRPLLGSVSEGAGASRRRRMAARP